MRNFLGTILVAASLSFAAGAAHANNYQRPAGYDPQSQTWLQEWDQWVDQFGEQFEDWIDGLLGIPDFDGGSSGGGGGGGGGTLAAPEIDPSGALAALTLLAGSLSVLRGRRAKK